MTLLDALSDPNLLGAAFLDPLPGRRRAVYGSTRLTALPDVYTDREEFSAKSVNVAGQRRLLTIPIVITVPQMIMPRLPTTKHHQTRPIPVRVASEYLIRRLALIAAMMDIREPRPISQRIEKMTPRLSSLSTWLWRSAVAVTSRMASSGSRLTSGPSSILECLHGDLAVAHEHANAWHGCSASLREWSVGVWSSHPVGSPGYVISMHERLPGLN